MIIDLPKTTSASVSKKLVQLRNDVGAMTLGRVLTLVIVVDDHQADEIIEAANDASRQHPCRIVVVVAGNRRGSARMDAQIRLGGDAGASEVVIMRLYGELAKHGQSVVVPLLLADSPVVAWWPHEFPADLRSDPIAQMAQRRITDSAESRNPREALKRLATQYQPGDTDLAWTRVTLWRGLLAAALDGPPYESVTEAVVAGASDSPSTELLAAWLGLVLKAPVRRVRTKAGAGVVSVRLDRKSGPIDLVRPDGAVATLSQPGQPDRRISLKRRGPRRVPRRRAAAPRRRRRVCGHAHPRSQDAAAGSSDRLRGGDPRRGTVDQRVSEVGRPAGAQRESRGGAGHGGGPATAGRRRHDGGQEGHRAQAGRRADPAGEGGRQAAREEGDSQAVHAMTGAEPTVEIYPSKQSLSDAAAVRFLAAVREAQRTRGMAQVALTGGSMGSAIFASLLQTPGRSDVDWSQVYVWWGDERYLPAGDANRNDTQNDEAGLSQLGLDGGKVFRVEGPDASASAEASASSYANTVRGFGRGEFDVVLLGVGPDGHVASLFPHHPAQRITDAVAVAVHDSPKPPPDRVSLTFECLNRTREVWFLVAGPDKADAVAAALAPDADRWDVPASGVRGSVATRWLLDEAAAANLG